MSKVGIWGLQTMSERMTAQVRGDEFCRDSARQHCLQLTAPPACFGVEVLGPTTVPMIAWRWGLIPLHLGIVLEPSGRLPSGCTLFLNPKISPDWAGALSGFLLALQQKSRFLLFAVSAAVKAMNSGGKPQLCLCIAGRWH